MSVQIREIENGLIVDVGGAIRCYDDLDDICATAKLADLDHVRAHAQETIAAILNRMGEREGGAQWLTASEIEAAGWISKDEADRLRHCLFQMQEAAKEATARSTSHAQRIEKLEGELAESRRGAGFCMTVVEDGDNHIVSQSPCSCVCGPLEKMEDAPRDELYTCAILKDTLGDTEWVKFYANAGDDTPIGFARIRCENLNPKENVKEQ